MQLCLENYSCALKKERRNFCEKGTDVRFSGDLSSLGKELSICFKHIDLFKRKRRNFWKRTKAPGSVRICLPGQPLDRSGLGFLDSHWTGPNRDNFANLLRFGSGTYFLVEFAMVPNLFVWRSFKNIEHKETSVSHKIKLDWKQTILTKSRTHSPYHPR